MAESWTTQGTPYPLPFCPHRYQVLLRTAVARRARVWSLAHPPAPAQQTLVQTAISVGDEEGALGLLIAAYRTNTCGLALGLRAPGLPFLDTLLVHVFGAVTEDSA